jgi:hypothetical protein
VSSAERIILSQRTTRKRLGELVAARQGRTLAVVGKGARHRRLLDWLAGELPNVEVYGPTPSSEYVAHVNRDPSRPIAYYRPG